MNIVFLGGSSFAANELIQTLSKGNKVYNFSRRSIFKKSVKNFYFDITKINKIKKLNFPKRIDFLFFFSSKIPFNENLSNWQNVKNTNVYSLIEFLIKIKCSVKKIINISSLSIYGDNYKNKILENTFSTPLNGYSLSKLAQENILRIFCNNKKIDYLNIRLGYVFGKGINKKRLVYRIARNVFDKKKMNVYNISKLRLKLIHVQEIKSFILRTYKKQNGDFNLVAHEELLLSEFIKKCLIAFKVKKEIFKIKNKKVKIKKQIFNISKIKKAKFERIDFNDAIHTILK